MGTNTIVVRVNAYQAEIEAILEDAPEISWEITNGGADTALNNPARAVVGLARL